MTDSPVGIAAWILEKFGAWTDAPRDGEGRPDLWCRWSIPTRCSTTSCSTSRRRRRPPRRGCTAAARWRDR
ncbi:hypothetical protein AB5I41_09955 [Sphingomonas sp. MMS24-JH45]